MAVLVSRALQEFGHIDILVNNAGGDISATTPRTAPKDGLDIHVEDIRRVVEINLLTVMYMCREMGRHMRERRTGKIINVGSIAGHVATTHGIIYAAAKVTVSHCTRCLAAELRPHDVNVNCIAPSPTFIGRFRAIHTIQEQESLSRFQQIGQPEGMAGIVLFLASPLSHILTGETIVCWHR